MSLQVDSMWNELNKTPPSDIKKKLKLPTENAMQYKQRELQSELFGLFMSSALTAP
jgi:hypothetical protein